MKKLFTFLIASMIGVTSFAQCVPDLTDSIAGLSPGSADIPCVVQGTAYDQTIKIYVPSEAAGITITSVRVDSIRNLPCGLKYSFNKLDRTFVGGERGCMQITGTTSDPIGQYRLKIYVTLRTSLINADYIDATTIPTIGQAFNVFVRVAGTGPCAALDTMPTPSTAPSLTSSCRFVTPDATVIPTLTTELLDLNVNPIPATNYLNISFNSDNTNKYNYTITNMVGATVYANTVQANRGENILSVDVSSMSNGIYFLNIKRDGAVLTKKIVISH